MHGTLQVWKVLGGSTVVFCAYKYNVVAIIRNNKCLYIYMQSCTFVYTHGNIHSSNYYSETVNSCIFPEVYYVVVNFSAASYCTSTVAVTTYCSQVY